MREKFLEPSWQTALHAEFTKPYWSDLQTHVDTAYRHHTVYPTREQIFAALTHCPLPTVKVVILGQDPYHGPHQAHGFSFSVLPPTSPPPSLQNIYKELVHDIGHVHNDTGDLRPWAAQGVLLLNTTLTVTADTPLSHRNFGWELFTDSVISQINTQREHVVFLLWGKHAQSKQVLIDTTRHYVLIAPHPSPLSAYRGFFGCGHFSACNEYLSQHGHLPINW